MTRSTRISRGAPAAAPTATATAASRIDSFGRVSKRVGPSSGKKSAVTSTDSTSASTARLDAIARFFVEKKQEEGAIKVDVVTELPSIELATPTKKTKKTKKAAAPAATTHTTAPSTQRKRRAAEALDADPASSPAAAQATPAKRARKIKQATTSVAELLARAAEKKSAATSSLQTATPADSDSDTPSQTAGDLIAQLNINTSFSAPSPSSFASSFARLRSTSTSPRPASTAPTTPCESDNESEPRKTFTYSATAPLPYELSELVRLHNAFSKALAVHHAHHGPSAPIDIRAFCPTVAQSWGKRKVTLEDIQRCLGVAMSGEIAGSDSIVSSLFLSDYTRGKICIELKPDVFSNSAAIGTLADQLNTAFESNLRSLWANAPHANATSSSAEVKQFIDSLPKAKATKSNSLLQTSALRAKGQRTLEELMHGIALKKQEKEAHEALLKAPIPEPVQETKADSMDVDSTPPAAPAAPMNLLDRIRYRQMQRTQLAAAGQLTAATPEELERRAALSRAGDIAEVMSMLCTAASLRQSNRVSFGMAAIVSKIKDSLVRLPIAREEAASCVRLLAKEVSPEWLQIVSMGGREIVIMMADRVPSKADIQQRVHRLS
ncbi:dna mismatch repair protein msh-2 [Ophiostoma piceae UAMH 11346]|uniref:Dna mismatch repair protein msh-2 n=1 Tax=Ophiostoma piceae (strain UAMH 11346) TaxID=1262450 RepID=S3CFA3_OPHP1|nr:dna mismatch repair protein msh-2 [Ophiostoma piceae UAMH 11346]